MGFRPTKGPAAFALGVGVRAAAVGGLIFAALWLAATRELYATALVLFALAVLIVFDLARSAAGADRVLAVFIDGLLAEGAERPSPGMGAPTLMAAIDRALSRLSRTRVERQSMIDYLQALADTVAAALIAVDDEGRVEWTNHAALRTLGEDGLALTAARLANVRPGHSAVIDFPEGARLVTVSGFRAPDGRPRRLIALQRLAGELDAVELKAWQDLARILSHEMMNSLTPICSLAESSAALLRADQPPTPEIAEAVEVIARRSAGLMSFVDRYRELAELPPPSKARMSAADFVGRIDALMGALGREKGIDYKSVVEPGLKLDADVELLEQAVINLVKNAFDAVDGRDDGAVRIELRSGADEVVIEVEDNGPGLAAGDADSIFVPFFSRKQGGSGIGLTLARQIALAHGGRIEHYPCMPTGALFRLTLPA